MKAKQTRIEVILCFLCMIMMAVTMVLIYVDRDWNAVWTSIGAVGCLYGATHFKKITRG